MRICWRVMKLGRAGLCGASVFQTGTGPGREQRVRLAVDCSLEHHMTHERELQSLAYQINWAYNSNTSALKPFCLYLTGLQLGGRIHTALTTHYKNFHHYRIVTTERSHDRVFSHRDIVYLSPDSENDLEEIDSSRVYVLGGIVDLTINKKLTLHRARLAGLSTARLPISKHMTLSSSDAGRHLNLPLNIVVDILLDMYGSDQSWPRVLEKHMPRRKGYHRKQTTSSKEAAVTNN